MNGMITDDLESFLEADSCTLIEYYPGNFLEELKKFTKNFNQCSRCFDRDSNRAPPEYANLLGITLQLKGPKFESPPIWKTQISYVK
jgi:hypothetical protein